MKNAASMRQRRVVWYKFTDV